MWHFLVLVLGGLISKLGKLGKTIRGSPLLLGISLLISGLMLLKDRADGIGKRLLMTQKN